MAGRNVEKRRKRRRRRKVKSSVKLIALIAVVVILAGTYAGLKIYNIRNIIDPYGDIQDQRLDNDEGYVLSEETALFKVYKIGKGEAILIKLCSVEALIDTGPENKADKLVKKVKKDVTGSLDYLILTGPSVGRTGGLSKILQNFTVNTIVLGEMGENEDGIRRQIGTFGDSKSVIDGADMSLDMGTNATLFIMKPEVSSDDPGDHSLVTYFTYGDTGFLALSDAGKEEISRTYGNVSVLNAIVLARYGATDVNMSVPEGNYGCFVIASATKDSGFPTEELSDHLNGTFLSTGKDGTIELISDGKSVDRPEEEVAPASGESGTNTGSGDLDEDTSVENP